MLSTVAREEQVAKLKTKHYTKFDDRNKHKLIIQKEWDLFVQKSLQINIKLSSVLDDMYAFAVSELPLMKDSPSLNFSLNLFQSNCSY